MILYTCRLGISNYFFNLKLRKLNCKLPRAIIHFKTILFPNLLRRLVRRIRQIPKPDRPCLHRTGHRNRHPTRHSPRPGQNALRDSPTANALSALPAKQHGSLHRILDAHVHCAQLLLHRAAAHEEDCARKTDWGQGKQYGVKVVRAGNKYGKRLIL